MTRFSRFSRVLWFTVAGLAVPALVAAQTTAGAPGSLLGGFVGLASADSEQGFTVGAAAGWQLGSRLVTEARMSWFERPAGAEAISAGLSMKYRIQSGPRVFPFVRAGLGLYIASFDSTSQNPPEYYRRRIAEEPGGGTYWFRDPALIAGAGVDLNASRSISWRPEVEVQIAWHGSQTFVSTAALLQISFHFEPHRVTPSTKARR